LAEPPPGTRSLAWGSEMTGLTTYIAKRLLGSVPIVLALSVLVFSIMHLVPGDPAQMMLGEIGVLAEATANLRKQLGLDDPIHVQYFRFISKALRGDFGRSFRSSQPVAQMLKEQFPSTFELTVAGLATAIVLGVLLGIIAAVRRNSMVDHISMLIALFGVSMPGFWFGLVLIMVFSFTLRLLPATGSGTLKHLILPALALGLGALAVVARLVRSSVLDVLKEDYVRTARAKGLSERVVIYRHVLRNSLIPVVTMVGLQFGRLLGGSVVIEQVFTRQGIGRLTVNAILDKDFQVVQGGVFLSALVFILVNLLVDISYAWLDPRVRYE